MGRQRRSRTEILLDVLEAVASEDGLTPTRLSTKANLPYDRLQPLLELLLSRRVIEAREDGRSTRLTLTAKGYRLLEELRRLRRVLRDFGLEVL